MFTDTHCHLDHGKFDPDRETAIARARDAGVGRILVPGLDLPSSAAAIKLAEAHPEIFAAVGFAPTDLAGYSPSRLEEIRAYAGHPKMVAIGEIGLDYYWVKDTQQRAFQRETLQEQLALATKMDKPVVIHMREQNNAWGGEASRDLLAILSDWQRGLRGGLLQRPGVLHSFNGTLETARVAIGMNFLIGVTGPVTYKNANEKRAVIREIPLESLLIETDSPYLTPEPNRGRRNEPAFVRAIADKIADIKSMTLEEVASVTTANAARLFLW